MAFVVLNHLGISENPTLHSLHFDILGGKLLEKCKALSCSSHHHKERRVARSFLNKKEPCTPSLAWTLQQNKERVSGCLFERLGGSHISFQMALSSWRFWSKSPRRTPTILTLALCGSTLMTFLWWVAEDHFPPWLVCVCALILPENSQNVEEEKRRYGRSWDIAWQIGN